MLLPGHSNESPVTDSSWLGLEDKVSCKPTTSVRQEDSVRKSESGAELETAGLVDAPPMRTHP